MPQRAEFWALLADAHVKQGQLDKAKIFYTAARECTPDNVHGFVTVSADAYTRYPTEQLAAIALNLGHLEVAEKEIERLRPMAPARAAQLAEDLKRIASMVETPKDAKPCSYIIITSPPMNGPKQDWDDVMHEKNGLGGSEIMSCQRRITGLQRTITPLLQISKLLPAHFRQMAYKKLGNYISIHPV